MLSGQSTDQAMCVLEGAATPCHRLAVYLAFQMTVPEIIIAGPNCLCVQSVMARNACVRRAFVHDIVRSLGDVTSQGQRIHDRYNDIV